MAKKLKTDEATVSMFARSMGKVFRVTAVAIGADSANAYMKKQGGREALIAAVMVDGVELCFMAEVAPVPLKIVEA